MRAVIQRVIGAKLSIHGNVHAAIGSGMVVLIGITHTDTMADVEWLCKKISHLRIFNDDNGVMNTDINTIGGECMVVSQFTLYASTAKGNRPSYIQAAAPATAKPVYEALVQQLQLQIGTPIRTGVFGADMQVELVNDGPVTICIDTQHKE